jgi:hypothetical protein
MSTRRRSRSALRRTPSSFRLRRLLAVEPLESRLLMAADFGDAPAPYPTTLAENGARHEAIGPMLGASRDSEADGVHSAAANADGADDNGVGIGALQVGQLGAEVVVTVQGAAPNARLEAWIDFNRDGSWSGPGERIAANRLVVNGQNTISFDIPATAMPGSTFARFRLSTAGTSSFKGAAPDGEVEDYAVTLDSPSVASGSFAARQSVSNNADGATGVFAADVDSDGDMDIVTAAYNVDTVAWHENNGNGGFVFHSISTTADGARSVVAIDLDRDGDIDVLSASELDNKIAWYENNGSESFTLRTISPATGVTSPGAKTVFVADVDSDGDLDVLSAHGSRTAWYENNGSQSFSQHLLPAATTGVFGLFAVDMDRDGDTDVLYSSASEGEMGWYENNGSQVFTTRLLADNAGANRSLIAADIDNDGDMDVIAAGSGAGSIPVLLFRKNGATFTSETLPSGLTGAWNVQAADMDGDGDLDVLAASSDEDRVQLIVNNGVNGFTHRTISTANNSPRGVIAADVDGNGRLDVVTASTADDSISWFRGTPRGDFDRDGNTDGDDYLLWQRTLGQTVPSGDGADGDASGTVTALDLAIWRAGFGAASSEAALQASVAAVDDDGTTTTFAPSELSWSTLFDASDERRDVVNAERPPTEVLAATVESRDEALAALAPDWPVLRRFSELGTAETIGDAAVDGLEGVEAALE